LCFEISPTSRATSTTTPATEKVAEDIAETATLTTEHVIDVKSARSTVWRAVATRSGRGAHFVVFRTTSWIA
jgi:hypothetical protein